LGASAQVRPLIVMLPPGRMSTITGCPQRLCSSSPIRRMKMSLVPPGPTEVIARIGLLG
jgi:hypothetical protein